MQSAIPSRCALMMNRGLVHAFNVSECLRWVCYGADLRHAHLCLLTAKNHVIDPSGRMLEALHFHHDNGRL